VKGHNGDKYNEKVDSMAFKAYESMIEKYNLPKTRVRR
jgi:ribonuclease HI